ncbi:MAG TPA: hypothetical protein VFJ96_10875 [Gemmatimonadaceae bacterium]|nr:hypothetical protein [Gemmatimonadaceae bacterium]
MKRSRNSRTWLQLAGALGLVALGWGGVLVEVLGTSEPTRVLPVVMVTGALVALTAGLVVALSRCRNTRDVVVTYVLYALAVLGGAALCTP